MGIGTPQDFPDPYVWSAIDVTGKALTITMPWNATTRALQDTTIVRDSGCVYRTILLGLGPDGTPDTSVNAYAVPVGTTTVKANQLNHNGLSTIDNAMGLQITAGF